jgi:DNA-binding transcriptional ArsR family regulator
VAAEKHLEEVGLGEELALVISNEHTVKALVFLVERAGSPKEIGVSLDISTPKASHHVKKLVRLGLVELIEEREVGGTIQHIYRAIVRPIVSTEEWDKLGIAERQRYSVWIVRMLLADATTSFNANLFDARSNRHLSRIPMVVDEQGLDEVAEIQNRALNELIKAEGISAERRVRSDDPGINIIAAMMCFELPGPSEGLNSRGDR